MKKTNNFINGSNALKLDNTFYEIVANNHNRFKVFNTNSNIPIQSNIFMIQQIYLDLIESISIFTFNFTSKEENLSLYAKNILKLYVMYMITEYGLYRSSNKNDFRTIFQVFEYMQRNNILSISNMTPGKYKLFFDEQKIQYNTMAKKKTSLKTFYTFYSYFYLIRAVRF